MKIAVIKGTYSKPVVKVLSEWLATHEKDINIKRIDMNDSTNIVVEYEERDT